MITIPLIVVLASALILLGLIFLRRRSPAILRPIKAFENLNKAIGLSVEDGSRLHISLGRGSLLTARGGSALAGLAMLRRIAERASVSDNPPIVTSGDASLALLSQDTLQAGYQAAGAEDQYRLNTGRLTGLTPFSYAAGTIPVIRDENASTNIIMGDFGPEVALIAEAADRENTFLMAASDNVSAQAVLYASSHDFLVGEELFASGAYVGAGPSHDASLQTQDILRWVIILALVGGSLMKLFRLI